MKKVLLLLLLSFTICQVNAQVYSPTLSTTSINKPLGANGYPLDARSYFYNSTKFIYRPYVSTAEVLSYLPTALNRTGQFPIIVNTGGTINSSTGVLTGGTNVEWWFKNGVTNSDLVLKQSAGIDSNYVKSYVTGVTQKLVTPVYGAFSDVVGVIAYGQSNSDIGSDGAVVSTTQKYDAVMPKSGVHVNANIDPNTRDFSDWLPLSEDYGETAVPGFCERFTDFLNDKRYIPSAYKKFQFFGMSAGIGSTSVYGLSPGTQPFTNLVLNVNKAKALANSKGKSFEVAFILWNQGEQDLAEGTSTNSYKEAMNALIAAVNSEVKQITGQTHPVIFIATQTAFTGSIFSNAIMAAHQQLANENPLFILSGTSNQIAYRSDIIHYNSAYRRYEGMYKAKAAFEAVYKGNQTKALQVSSIDVVGNTLKIHYNNTEPLVFDTVAVPFKKNYGFLLRRKSDLSEIDLSNIHIEDKSSVSIDCSEDPNNGILIYGFDPGSGPASRGSQTLFLNNRGNLHDLAGVYNKDGAYQLNNWALSFFGADGIPVSTFASSGGGASGVSSFNSRTGVVTPQSGDYSSFYQLLTLKNVNGGYAGRSSDGTVTGNSINIETNVGNSIAFLYANNPNGSGKILTVPNVYYDASGGLGLSYLNPVSTWFDNTLVNRGYADSRYGQRVSVPSLSTSPGASGQWASDDNYFYWYGTTRWNRVPRDTTF